MRLGKHKNTKRQENDKTTKNEAEGEPEEYR